MLSLMSGSPLGPKLAGFPSVLLEQKNALWDGNGQDGLVESDHPVESENGMLELVPIAYGEQLDTYDNVYESAKQ